MTLQPGRTLLHYRLVEKIGEGGMGVVWKALDTTLDRQVAIKILPDLFAGDRDRLSRFEREAKLLASLNHPSIASIHGLHSDGDLRFIVMELVEGESLQQRLARGPIPLRETLGIAIEIARALEAAHERGVIHRDLKPANVQITPEGKVKVLDFGLAKALETDTASGVNPSLSPTLTSAGTVAGVILGTAAYMSPEQARGHAADHRSDVWALGALLFEMLTGRSSFEGDTVSDTLASVLKLDPDYGALPAGTPERLRRLIARCLQKDRAERLHAIADARIVLEEVLTSPAEETAEAETHGPAWRNALPWVVAAAAIVLAAVAWLGRPAVAPEKAVTRVSIQLPEGLPLTSVGDGFGSQALAVSPDGRTVYYLTEPENAPQMIYRRSLDSETAEPIAGTEDTFVFFLSPDGERIGFVAGAPTEYASEVKTIPASGGTPLALDVGRTVGFNCGGHWSDDGTIIFAGGMASGLFRIPAGGGAVTRLTEPDRANGEISHRHPYALPGGKAVLFTIKTNRILSFDDATIAVVTVDTGEVRKLVVGGAHPSYLPTGHLVYHSRGSLVAVPFDAETLEVTGSPVLLVDDVASDPANGSTYYAFSRSGTLVYTRGQRIRSETSLVRIDRDGAAEPLTGLVRHYMSAGMSPDERRIAVELPAANNKIWILDLEREILTRLTFGPGNDGDPLWSPDGAFVYFRSDREGPYGMYRIPVDGGTEEPVVPGETGVDNYMGTLSPDGRVLVYERDGPDTGADLLMLAVDGDGDPEPFLRTEFDETMPRLDPSGRWLAYLSNESGQPEVYLRRFPDASGKVQVTSGAGAERFFWGADGHEIFYVEHRRGWRSIAVDLDAGPRFGRPRPVFENREHRDPVGASADGRRFLAIDTENIDRSVSTRLEIVLNWFEDVKRRTQ